MPAASPAQSLFASDYSLGAPVSPKGAGRPPSTSSHRRHDSGSLAISRTGSIAQSRGSQQIEPPLSPSTPHPSEDNDEIAELFTGDPLSRRTAGVRHSHDSAISRRTSEASRMSKNSGRSEKSRLAQQSFDGAMEGESITLLKTLSLTPELTLQLVWVMKPKPTRTR